MAAVKHPPNLIVCYLLCTKVIWVNNKCIRTVRYPGSTPAYKMRRFHDSQYLSDMDIAINFTKQTFNE